MRLGATTGAQQNFYEVLDRPTAPVTYSQPRERAFTFARSHPTHRHFVCPSYPSLSTPRWPRWKGSRLTSISFVTSALNVRPAAPTLSQLCSSSMGPQPWSRCVERPARSHCVFTDILQLILPTAPLVTGGGLVLAQHECGQCQSSHRELYPSFIVL